MPPSARSDPSGPRRIGAVAVAFRLIRALEAAEGALTLTELARRAGMPSSKAHAYVASFVHEGMMAQDPETGRYGFGSFALQLGVAALRQSDLVELVRREAAALAEATTSSIILATWGNRGPTIVFRLDGRRRGPTSIQVGYVLPVWQSATGRVFLAALPAGETAALMTQERAAGRLPSVAAVRAEIARVRRDGIAVAIAGQEFAGMAAPVVDHEGRLVAALTLSRPQGTDTPARRAELSERLRAVTAGLSARLGFDPARQRAAGRPRSHEKDFYSE